jgi:hypothetical protein
MSFRLSTLRSRFGLAALAASAVLVGSAQAGSRRGVGRPIEFTEPRSYEVTTNLNQLTSKKDSLKQLEEDLYRPVQSFTPKSSLDGVMAPPLRAPAPSAIQSKRAKELLERRRNWVFMSPEDLFAAPTVEQILKAPDYGPGGLEKKEMPTLERYYHSLAPKRPARTSSDTAKEDELFNVAKKSTAPEAVPENDDSDLPAGLKESADALKNLFQTGKSDSPLSQGATPTSFSDPFGLASRVRTDEQTLAHKQLMDEYRTLLDPISHPPAVPNAAGSAFALSDTAPSTPEPVAALPSIPTPNPRKSLDSLLNAANPLLGPAPLPDVNAKALGQTRPASALPKVEERRPKPTAPDFTAPRRAF